MGTQRTETLSGQMAKEPSFSPEHKCENSRLKAAVHIVRHEQQHAELLQGNELHVTLIALAHLQPLKQGVRVHICHDG